MKVKKSQAVSLLQSLKFHTAAKLPAAKLEQKLNEIAEDDRIANGKVKPGDKENQNLLKAILAALDDEKEITVVEDGKAESKKPVAAAAKNGKTKAGKTAVEDEDDEDDDDEEEEDDEDEEESEEEEEESDEEEDEESDEDESEEESDEEEEEDEDDDEDEKPAKKKVAAKGKKDEKPAKKKSSGGNGGEKDSWGARLGSATSSINSLFVKNPKRSFSVKELEEEGGRGSIGGLLRKHLDAGRIVKDDKGYRLAPTAGGKTVEKKKVKK